MSTDNYKILAFTGAGISKASGIPTFADIPGIRLKLTRKYADKNPEEYRRCIDEFQTRMQSAEPNDAHIALAEYDIPIITMNVDKLHTKAGSKNVLEIHGEYPDCILYGDIAPEYPKALKMIEQLPYRQGVILIIGVSFFTKISDIIKKKAKQRGARVIIINDDAKTKVRAELEHLFKAN